MITRVLAPVRGRLAAAVVLQALAAAIGVVPLITIALIADALLAPAPDSGEVWRLVALGGGAAVLALALTTAATTITHLADVALQLDLRRRLAAHLGRVPPGWFSKRNSGQVSVAVGENVHTLHYLVAHTLIDVTTVVITPLVAVVALSVWSPVLGLLALVPPALGLLLWRRAMAGAGPLMAEYARAQAEIHAGIVEFVEGIAVVKTFGRAREAHRRFASACDAFHDFFTAWQRRTTGVTTASQLVVSPVAALLPVLVVGTVLVRGGVLDGAALVAALVLAPAVAAPVAAIGPRVQALRGGLAAAGSLVALLDSPEQPRVTEGPAPSGTAIALRGVHARHPGAGTDALAGIDLDLPEGSVTALVGPSGAGKSTLAALLPRLLDPSAGHITLGGVELRELDARTLYRHVGFVFQTTTLLRGSVAEIIALGRPDAGRDEIARAARAAQIHERIAELPRGYDSVLGEDAAFSGGEEQRLAIARALLADTPVLVLDEATAFADPDSEAAILEALSALVRRDGPTARTVLVVAHRLHTIAGADRIVVLDHGLIAEQGTHTELLGADGRYARMWAAQEDPETVVAR